MLATPDQQISLTDPDARSMATSGRGFGVVGYNVQIAVEAENHLIVMHEVTNDGTDRSQLSHVANETKAALGVEKLDAVADRGYFNSEEIRACEEAGITVTLPKPMTSNAKAEGRFGKQDFRYVADEDVYVCPAGENLAYHYTTEENGLALRRYWTNACQSCAIKPTCTTGKERRISRWEHEHILEAVQRRLDEHPEKMRQRRKTVEHPFGTIKARMGATHFLMKTLPRVASEMALHVLAYNLDLKRSSRPLSICAATDGRTLLIASSARPNSGERNLHSRLRLINLRLQYRPANVNRAEAAAHRQIERHADFGIGPRSRRIAAAALSDRSASTPRQHRLFADR